MPPSVRRAGITVPLFSLRSARSWGIGEIGDLVAFADLVGRAGIGLVQLLPLGAIAGGDTSPYAAVSAFGIDPMFVSIEDVVDLPPAAAATALGDDGLAALRGARASERVEYDVVRPLKLRALRAAFAAFRGAGPPAARARELAAFRERERAWLADYALFAALKAAHDGAAWWTWPRELRDRDPDALGAARERLADETALHEYVQWIALGQWSDARAALRARGIEVMGDLPFMVGRDSADVWSNQGEFRMGASVGAPPDAFDEDGQDWDLPPYDWKVMAEGGHRWLRRRAEHAASLYDRFRVDHVVGFYRTYARPSEGKRDARGKLTPGTFDPPAEPAQLAQGEAVLGAMMAGARDATKGPSGSGATLVAEDLGVIPPFVRRSLGRLGVPGYRVLIWEKDGKKYRDPSRYPETSVACFGTHDTAPVRAFWEGLAPAERRALCALPALARLDARSARWDAKVHEALFELVAGSGSELVLLLAQDVLGTTDRVNTPGTVGSHNWSYRLPMDLDALGRDPEISAKLEMVARVLSRARRATARPGG